MSHAFDEQLRELVRHFQPVDHQDAYECEVVAQQPDGSLDLKPADARLGPGLQHVPLRSPWPGVSLQVVPGTRVQVSFLNGDPARPVAELWEPGAGRTTQLVIVADTTIIQPLLLVQHLGGTGLPPIASQDPADGPALQGGTAVAVGTDTSFLLTCIVKPPGMAPGQMAKVTFGRPFAVAPNVGMSPIGGLSLSGKPAPAGLGGAVDLTITPSYLTLMANGAPVPGTYIWSFVVVTNG